MSLISLKIVVSCNVNIITKTFIFYTHFILTSYYSTYSLEHPTVNW